MLQSQPVLDVKAPSSAKTKVDAEIVFAFTGKDQKPGPVLAKYSKLMGQLKSKAGFTGSFGSSQFVRFGGKRGASHVLLVGLGNPRDLTDEKVRVTGGNLFAKLCHEKVKTALVQAEGAHGPLSFEKFARAFGEGLAMSGYRFDKYKAESNRKPYTLERVSFLVRDPKAKKVVLDELHAAESAAKAVNLTRDWSNEPSNIGTPEFYAAQAQAAAKKYGLKCTVLTEKDAAKEKMGLFLGVGQGSEREGRIVILEYSPKTKLSKTIALVGKGVTFDSGGISIKPSLRMEEMKHDMTGAATVMGAILLAAQWKIKNKVIAILAFTENMPSGNAIQPGNILTARNGKTVEIINTDAEGRLILADALDYAQDLKPDAIVDVATLTGAVSIALGKYCCGILGNDQELIQEIRKMGDAEGERIWQLPLYDDYFEDLKSEHADMKNSANDSYGGTIRGAIFLKQFIRKGCRWAHLDIAATGSNIGHLSYFPRRGASGAYVRTLATFAANF